MSGGKFEYRGLWRKARHLVFGLLLFIYPFLKIREGIDLTDTGYSLGNYRFFGEMDGVWMLLTFLSNAWGEVLCNPSGERDRAFGVSIFPDQNAVLAGLRRGNRRNQLLLVSRGDSV